ncbi:hypothetical protein [Zoogloea sp. LCSB751]|uniref:hypothetical protein n=1 Tax=Zoogloea sp. LCSB751 TaxID=1965277 RepID=UPI0009A52950|nr:hypothetical protein [Zoogloea sp. LCSB751]
MEASEAIVTYIAPGESIARGIRSAVSKHDTAVTRIAKCLGITNCKVGRSDFSIERIGIGKNITLAQALVALSDTVKHPIVIVIDDVERTLTSQVGVDSLFALKAAQDELNGSAHDGFTLRSPDPTATSWPC